MDMGKPIKFRAIIGGFCTFLGGSIVWTLFIVVILAPLVRKATIIWVLNLLVAYTLMFRSGMFSAALARTHEHLHAVIVAILAILYSFIWFHETPTWFWILYIPYSGKVLMKPLFLGGLLRHARKCSLRKDITKMALALKYSL